MSVAIEYAMALETKFNESDSRWKYEFEVVSGQKFDKIVSRHFLVGEKPQSASVFAFVERTTGDLIKAATWKAPAKLKTGWATKYNLNTQFELAVEVADPYGSFLYQ